MSQYNRSRRRIILDKYLCAVDYYQIVWRQHVTKTGEICGMGHFTQNIISDQRRGNWSKTLQKRIIAMHKKGKDWGVIKEK